MTSTFGTLNWTILIVYISGNLVLGYFLSKRINTANDFYLGGRTTPWWAIGISVIATYVSALSFLGAPAWSYANDLSVIALHLNYPLVIFIVITFFLPFFFNAGVPSIYDYMERRFGKVARGLISTIFLLQISISSAAILYATSLVIQFITGVDVIVAIVIVSSVALVYTVMGGITAVIWTDVIQAGVLLVGAMIIVFALVTQLPMPLMEHLGELKLQGKMNALDYSIDFTAESTIWSGLIGMTIFHVTVYGGNQMMVQRTLAAKNIGDAKKSYLLMGFTAFFIYFLFFFLGVLLYGYYGGAEFENGNTIILHFAEEYGLPGLMGVITAAIVAASMSTLDSALNSLATVSNVDFYQKYFKKNESDTHYLRVTRGFTVFWALAIIMPAILLATTEGSVLQTMTKIGSYFVGAKFSMYLLGFFSRQTTEKGLLIGVAMGFLAVWYVALNTDIAWPWYSLIGGSVNMVAAILASRLIDGRQQEWPEYSIRGQREKYKKEGLAEKEHGWYVIPGKIDRISYVLLVFLVLSILFLYLLGQII